TDLDVGQSAFPTNEFNQHYDEVSRELELEKKRKDMIPEKTGTEFWHDEPIDGMDVAELEQYLSSLQELNRKVLTHADELMMMNNAPALFGSVRTECAAGSARTECAAGSAGTECGAGSAGTECSESTGSIC
nr:agamous-like MADS-box protein AGL62 [Tanacetum cinerariifolium]